MNETEAQTKQRRLTLHYLTLIKSSADGCAAMLALSDELREQSRKPMLALAGSVNHDPNADKAQRAREFEAGALGQLNDLMVFVGKLQAVLKPPPEKKGESDAGAN